jgi:hypothetical protein
VCGRKGHDDLLGGEIISDWLRCPCALSATIQKEFIYDNSFMLTEPP